MVGTLSTIGTAPCIFRTHNYYRNCQVYINFVYCQASSSSRWITMHIQWHATIYNITDVVILCCYYYVREYKIELFFSMTYYCLFSRINRLVIIGIPCWRVLQIAIEVITRRAKIFYYTVFLDTVKQEDNGHNCDHELVVRNIFKTSPPTEPALIFIIL